MKAIALDDEQPALDVIAAFARKCEGLELDAIFTKSTEAFQYINNNKVDLLFLDINMPSVSGLDFMNFIPQGVMVIFTTSYSEYAVESYNRNAVDYLLKPFSLQRFKQAVIRAEQRFQLESVQTEDDSFMMVNTGTEMVKIIFTDINYVSAADNYLNMHLVNAKPLLVRMTMAVLEEKLPPQDFMRVHRSYIINLRKVKSIGNRILKIDDAEIPIGKNYNKEFSERIKGLL